MTILLAGARGKIARAVGADLMARGLKVRLASRDPWAAEPVAGAELVLLDLADPASAADVLAGVSQVFLYADPSTARSFVSAAETAGVAQVVLLSSAASQGDSDGAADPATDPHGAAERIIATGAFAATFLRPGAFMSNALFWAHSIRATGQVRLPYLDAEEAPIDELDLADVAVRVLLDGPGGTHDGRGYELSGPASMTRRRQVELIGEVVGVPVEPVDLTVDQAREELGRVMRSPARLQALLSYWSSRVGVPYPVNDTVDRLTGRPARPFADWVRANVAHFR